MAGCCVLWVRKCGWIFCAVGEGVWLRFYAVGEEVWLDVVYCG